MSTNNSPKSPQLSEVKRERSMREPDKLKVFITTWNMGNAEAGGMKNIFDEQNATERFDVFAIGLQESTYSTQGDCIQHLAKQIAEYLGPDFYQVEHCYRAQLQLYLFARKALQHRVTNVEKSAENTGILHIFPNKGGLLVTLNIDGTKLAFVSCHLTAHVGVKHCEERNASIVEILGGVRAGDKDIDITEQFHHVFWMGDMNYRTTFDQSQPANAKKNIAMLHEQLKANQQQVMKLDDVDVHFGDDDNSDDEEPSEAAESMKQSKKLDKLNNMKKVLDMIVKGQYSEIMKYDELTREIAANRVLNDFIALQPSFAPTFKRSRNRKLSAEEAANCSLGTVSAESGRASFTGAKSLKLEHALLDFYNEKRIPSYTDRILYKSMPVFKTAVKPLFFDSCEAAISSDHKPVRAGFELTLSKGMNDILVDKKIVHRRHYHEAKILRLRVTDLKGYELEEMDSILLGGGSDPYIVFKTDPASLLIRKRRLRYESPGIKTSTIIHNLNPVWPDVIDLEFASIDIEALSQSASLIMQVWDKDNYNADDLIGVCTIPFTRLFDAFLQNSDFQFDEIIRSNSEVMGRITGTIKCNASDFHEILTVNKAISQDRYRNTNFIPLARAVAEYLQPNSGCCTIQ